VLVYVQYSTVVKHVAGAVVSVQFCCQSRLVVYHTVLSVLSPAGGGDPGERVLVAGAADADAGVRKAVLFCLGYETVLDPFLAHADSLRALSLSQR